jgi:hypothetical protein
MSLASRRIGRRRGAAKLVMEAREALAREESGKRPRRGFRDRQRPSAASA